MLRNCSHKRKALGPCLRRGDESFPIEPGSVPPVEGKEAQEFPSGADELALLCSFAVMFQRHPTVTILLFTLSLNLDAGATSLNVVGLFPGKAVVSIDGGSPRTITTENEINGIRLLGTTQDNATFLIQGRRETLRMGQYLAAQQVSGSSQSSPDLNTTMLSANPNGHFTTQGSINGGGISFLIDTGASLVMLSAAEANRLGIRYKEGRPSLTNTANGQVTYYRITLSSVTVGNIQVNNVEAGVMENGLGGNALLGMSFLSRIEMTQSGNNMVLAKRL